MADRNAAFWDKLYLVAGHGNCEQRAGAPVVHAVCDFLDVVLEVVCSEHSGGAVDEQPCAGAVEPRRIYAGHAARSQGAEAFRGFPGSGISACPSV